MRIPARATYRVQLNREFGFDDAAQIASYLAELGVSHLYTSPMLQAVRGSMHGYDVVDHGTISAELGGQAAHARLHAALEHAGLGQILDIVPNHMAIGTRDNALWWDVLENGPASQFASYFDVDWDAGRDNRVLLPILGEPYFEALQAGTLQLAREGVRFVLRYHDHLLPAAPRTLAAVLRAAAPSDDTLGFWADALENLPAPSATDRESTARRQRDKAVIFEHLAQLFVTRSELADAIDAELRELNADPTALDAWLERQNWRITHWQNAATELGYRRFFDVNSLAGLRVEDPRVFQRSHRLILQWLRDGTLDGVRIDHVDGLRDPEEYLTRLHSEAPQAYVVVEKILQADECLPTCWPVHGTTGYEFAALLDHAFLDAAGEPALTALATRFGASHTSWSEQVREAKLQILEQVLASEREQLTDLAHRVLTRTLALRDCTRRDSALAISELLVGYPVYRTYLRAGHPAREADLACVRAVIAQAAEHAPQIAQQVWSTLERALCLDLDDPLATELALRVQQVTGAITAKAVEDTVFYRHMRLLALNEVGGTPATFALSVAELHRALTVCPHKQGLLATATHDTKRGEDMRARLLVLSERAQAWEQAVNRWSARSARYRDPCLSPTTEYFFYQTLVGAYPLDAERAWQYLQKAVREAKRESSWIRPDAHFEAQLERFVRGVLADSELMQDVSEFVASIAHAGYLNALSRTLIKLCATGVPDLYQGTELWDFSLVDPDNRRPVDFAQRRALLARLPQLSAAQVMSELAAGTPKLWLIWKTLGLRQQKPELFEAEYRALDVDGPDAASVIAFARGDALMVVVPRHNAGLSPAQRTAHVLIPAGNYRDILSSKRFTVVADGMSVRVLFAQFPCALWEREA